MNRKLIAGLVMSLALPFAAMAADTPAEKEVKADTMKADANAEKTTKDAKADAMKTEAKAEKKADKAKVKAKHKKSPRRLHNRSVRPTTTR